MNTPLHAVTFGDAPSQCESLLRGVRSAAPVLRRDAELADQHSELTAEAVDALRDAGLFRLGVPGRFGGYEADLTTTMDVTSEVAMACPSSAWIITISYAAQQIAASYDEQALQDMWADGPDKGICGAFRADTAVAQAADGGVVVSGRWSWASGCHHASWALLAVPPLDQAGAPGLALVPLADLSIEKTWNMLGMRGTGSDTVVADEVFVPQHRIRSFASVLRGTQDSATSPLYRISPGSMTLTMLAPLLGAAREVFQRTTATVRSGKPLAMTFYTRSSDSPSVQAALADAANLIDSAELHLNRSANFLDSAAGSRTEPTLVERGRVRMDMAHASTCIREAMQHLMTISGASGFRNSSTIERYWRDVETAARHPNLYTGLHREIYGRAIVGNDIPITPLL